MFSQISSLLGTSIVRSFGYSFLAIALTIGSFLLQRSALNELRLVRNIERTPYSTTQSLFPGPVKLSGRVTVENPLRAPHSGNTTVFYRATIEEERRRNNKREWVTIDRQSRSVIFLLKDEKGVVAIHPSSNAQINAPLKYRSTQGKLRYSEYRIDPGDNIVVLGLAETTPQRFIRFPENTDYRPFISTQSEHTTRSSMTLNSILYVCIGVVLLVFAIHLIFLVFQIHHTFLFLASCAVCVSALLTVQGLSMLSFELRSAVDTYTKRFQSAQQMFEDQTSHWSPRPQWIEFDVYDYETFSPPYLEWSRGAEETWNSIRSQIMAEYRNVNQVLQRFPERFIAPMLSLPEIPQLVASPSLSVSTISFSDEQIPPFSMPIVAMLSSFGALLLLVGAWLGFREVRRKRLIEIIPQSATNAVTFGLDEVQGIAQPSTAAQPIFAPHSKERCLYFWYCKERRVRQGKNRSWVVEFKSESSETFLCRDTQGEAAINPKGAAIYPAIVRKYREGSVRHTEKLIVQDEPLYVLGYAQLVAESDHSLSISADPDRQYPFYITTKGESWLQNHLGAKSRIHLILAFLGTLVVTFSFLGGLSSFTPVDYLIAAMVAVCTLILGVMVIYFNDLVFLHQRLSRERSNIDVALKKRLDLISQLTSTVSSFMAHERNLLEQLANLRRTAKDSCDGQSTNIIPQAQSISEKLQFVIEAYPTLKAHELTERLARAVTAVENELELRRGGYNDAVELYNTKIHHVPEILIAKLFSFKAVEFWRS